MCSICYVLLALIRFTFCNINSEASCFSISSCNTMNIFEYLTFIFLYRFFIDIECASTVNIQNTHLETTCMMSDYRSYQGD